VDYFHYFYQIHIYTFIFIMLAAILSGFLCALLFLLIGKHLKGRLSALISILPLSLFVYFLGFLPKVAAGEEVLFKYTWIPSLGINLDFRLDGLALLFASMITGIGFLVFLYASSYMEGNKYVMRFYGYLCAFMAAMLGLVLADNVLLLFIFWELTSITSFFLIGFNNENEASRKSALLALAITGGGGFFLLAGIVMMESITGSYSIHDMIQMSDILHNHPMYLLIIWFVLTGAFTKSAQFPFHFWLPGAMKAPTPVSAYLHSATMVKAGIYLLARFTPILGDDPFWNYTLIGVGGVTMLYGAFHSIFRVDLKGILAYSTIAALGMLVFLIGIGSEQALLAAAVFILVHALYKAALFLITGIIDHETGTRDITQLAGLRVIMLPVAIAGALAALSSAGMPLTFGFIGKDLIYEATLHEAGNLGIALTVAAFITNSFLVYAGFLAGVKPFLGKLPTSFAHLHLPHPFMWIPPVALALLGVLYGLFPALVDVSIMRQVVVSMGGGAEIFPLKIWHGLGLVLLLSIATLAVGLIFFLIRKPSLKGLNQLDKFTTLAPENVVNRIADGVTFFSTRYTATLHNGYLRVYLLTIVMFLTGLIGGRMFFSGIPISIDYAVLSQVTFHETVVVVIILIAILRTVSTSSRLTAVAAMGIVGYCICLLFVFYSAPDLAMTQFTIDTLTVVLFVLVLFRLPSFLNLANPKVLLRDGFVSLAFGSVIALIALLVLKEPVNEETSIFYAENSYLLAKGKNVVNVILVDFRGFDTLFEITVLTVATIGVFSLLKLRITSGEKD
jgi:multicomponent Na+:H+ antiporter subunit A